MQWAEGCEPRHIEGLETASRLYNVFPRALARVYPAEGAEPIPTSITVAPLAIGGAMAVYKITAQLPHDHTCHLVCKIPHQRRLVYTADTQNQTTEETTRHLLDHLVTLADHLTQQAPGLFPRSGGAWHWQDADGTPQHLLIEEFIPGLSVERLHLKYEQQFQTGEVNLATYQQRRTDADRLAMATFVRLWDGLGRHTFTSDPSPWNILVQHPDAEPLGAQIGTIIDLHGLEEDIGLWYVVQRLAAVYGMRQETLEGSLLPGVLDALGEDVGRLLLLAELPRLEAEAARTQRNLGVDVQQPLLRLIRRLG